MAARLLAWYDRHRRDLPWRGQPGDRADPYRVWLSEIMLQQTTVAAVGPYFRAFTARWPTVADLAAADLEDVLRAWAGLGYYARARNLHRCARAVVAGHGGVFPDTEAGLRQLPGVGPYTAAAVAAIAFDRPATALDGNVERVMARLFDVHEPLPKAKETLRRLAATLVPMARPGDYTQALFDLGATVCTPRKPRCMLCPWAQECRARAAGTAESLPMKAAKPVQPVRHGTVFHLTDGAGRVLLRRRPEQGLLGGMMELPSTPWTDAPASLADAIALAPAATRWTPLAGSVRHTFTHFHLHLTVLTGQVADAAQAATPIGGPVGGPMGGGVWVAPEGLGGEALPTVMRKVLRHAGTSGGAKRAGGAETPEDG